MTTTTITPTATRRPTLGISTLLAALALLTACPGTGADDEDTSETGDESADTGVSAACIDPGSELFPEARPVNPPVDDSGFTCTEGWATDAPTRDASWTVKIDLNSQEFFFWPFAIEAHPDGGVILAAAGGTFTRYDGDGNELWSSGPSNEFQEEVYLTVEDAGTIVLSTYNWNTEEITLTRYDADGNESAPIAVAWNSSYANIWALESFGSDLVIGARDEDSMGFYETTLLRLDAMDNELLRKSSNQVGGQTLAVNAGGTVLFGTFPGFLVALDNGAVLGMLTPSNGNLAAGVGGVDGDNDFYIAGNASGDFSVGRYSGIGSERWLQTYDRATLGDQGRAVDVDGSGTIVAVGSTSVLDFATSNWFGTQPVIIAADADGNALWTDRIAAYGEASAVSIGSAGEVYVAGLAEADGPANIEPTPLMWMRRYEL